MPLGDYMKNCLRCGNDFPIKMEIDGKVRNLDKRKYCVDCSPFGSHNTRSLHKTDTRVTMNVCKICNREYQGGHRKHKDKCGRCYSLAYRTKIKQRAIDYKGGCCSVCGYNKYIGSLPLNKHIIETPEHAIVAATEKKYSVVNDPSSVQGSIRIARHFPNRHHPDFAPVQVLNNIFGGFFGSRLMSNIREDKGYTYGIHSYLQNHIQQSAWLISTDAGKDVCRATIDEVYKEMAILRNELVEMDELNLVKNYMLGSLLGDVDGPFQIIGRWKSYILNGLTEEYFYNTIKTVRAIQPQQLQELANKYLNESDFYELVVY
jgi:hypothetical protein